MKDMQTIPRVALGLWKVNSDDEFFGAFDAARAAGYRHFDSAQVYDNEHLLGEAWRRSALPREELFLTTKISVTNFGYKRTMSSFSQSLTKLQTDYVDLLLLHFPVTGLRKNSWKALEELLAGGTAKRIGVSNYTIKHLEEMKKYTSEMPSVNQVELHVFLQQPELLEYCRDHDIAVEAYSPLAHGKDMDNEVIKRIASKHERSYAQIMLRWCIEKDLIILPKSVTPERIQQNIAVLDFALDQTDMTELTTLDRDLRTCWNPTYVP